MTRIEAEILRDQAGRPGNIKLKNLQVDFVYYPSGITHKIILSGRRASIPRLFDVLDMIYPRDVIVSLRGLNWYDRNPTTIGEQYNDSVAGHSSPVDRITYTVPTDRIALIESLTVNAARTGASTGGAVGWVNVRWFVNDVRVFTMNFYNDTAGDADAKIERTLGSAIALLQGDILRLETQDSSTGGSISYECAFKGTEFDA